MGRSGRSFNEFDKNQESEKNEFESEKCCECRSALICIETQIQQPTFIENDRLNFKMDGLKTNWNGHLKEYARFCTVFSQ